MKNQYHIRRLFIYLICIGIFVLSSFLNINVAYADAAVVSEGDTHIKGNEDATDPDDFDAIWEQNLFKMWSILKSMGMTDEQACGVMGTMLAESGGGLAAWLVEGQAPYTFYTQEEVDKYVEEVSSKYEDEHNRFFQEVSSSYANSGQGINSYYYTDYDNVLGNQNDYFPGIGIPQFTGSGACRLLKWAKENNVEWWDFDTQMTFFLVPFDQEGYNHQAKDRSKNAFENLMDDNPSSVVDSVKWWATYVEGHSPDGSRIPNGEELYKIFKGMNWDSEYGEMILSGAGMKARVNNDIIDVSALYDIASKVLIYPQNSGFLLDYIEDQDKNFEAKNADVYQGYVSSLQGEADTSKEYCLYELFGEDVHWYRYLGEATYAPELLDHIYSAVVEDRVKKLTLGSILDYESKNYLSCNVYNNRAEVLTSEDLANGYKDPRVLAIKTGYFNGYVYTLANIKMGIAKYLSSMVSFLLGPRLLIELSNWITKIETSDIWKAIKPALMTILAFAMLFFIFSLVKKAKKYAIGTGSGREFISRFLFGFISLGLLFASLANPTRFNDLIVRGITIVDGIFDEALESNVKNDEVISISDDASDELIVSAYIWRVCIFQPWCRGQFGDDYEHLYTTYEDVDALKNKGIKDASQMEQSHEEVDPEDNTGKAFYNSAKYTGDIVVPIGGGKLVRNWAAYLMSCGSKYHLDFNLVDEASELTASKQPVYPMANTTAYDPTLMADTFRVIDAQMNIAPQEYNKDKLIINNYTDSKSLTNSFGHESRVMLLNAALLIFFIPIIASKFKNFVILIIVSIQLIYHSIVELFKENSGLKQYGPILRKSFVNYFLACIKGYIMLLLYIKFVDQGFIKMVIYCILCIVILSYGLQDIRDLANKTKYKIRRMRGKSGIRG